MLKLVQIGLNTADMAGTLRLLSEACGFANAGGQVLWGPPIRVQGLQESDRALMWWLLGRRAGMQLELFQHTSPPQRPLRPDWRPCDLGWTRFGVAVPNFDAALAALASNGVALLADPVTRDGLRRASFREPYIGCVIELLEDGPGTLWATEGDAALPVIAYATSSVSDIATARQHYEGTLGMTIEPIERLHSAEDEACWGLDGAEREGFLAHLGDVRLEIIAYETPRGRPKPADYRTSDQGIVNVALRAGTPDEARAMFDRLAETGLLSPHRADGEGAVSGYITTFERELELIALPAAIDPIIGFEAKGPFLADL